TKVNTSRLKTANTAPGDHSGIVPGIEGARCATRAMPRADARDTAATRRAVARTAAPRPAAAGASRGRLGRVPRPPRRNAATSATAPSRVPAHSIALADETPRPSAHPTRRPVVPTDVAMLRAHAHSIAAADATPRPVPSTAPPMPRAAVAADAPTCRRPAT